jgi:hypothetical protein
MKNFLRMFWGLVNDEMNFSIKKWPEEEDLNRCR